MASADKKSSRATKEGVIASYIHLQGRVGVLIEVNCETDFVAKNVIFQDFVKDLTLQIAASQPLVVNREEVDPTLVEKEKEIYRGQVSGKPAEIAEKIVAGKLDKFYSSICLMEQDFIKDSELTIKDYIASKIAELGENIVVRRFTRYAMGEEIGTAPEVSSEE